MKKKVIWSNYNLDYEDWKDFFDDEYPDLDEDKRIDLMYELNNEHLDDERMNLDIPDLCCEAIHHDGTDHYLYRVFKPDISDTRKENFLNKICRGTVTRADITRITRRLGDKIAEVYGWKI